jgi:hypothetical protein
MKISYCAFLLLCVVVLSGAARRPPAFDDFLAAIAEVETGRQKDPSHAVGDHGEALGRYQLHKAYYLDAAAYLRKHGVKDVPPYAEAATDDDWAALLVRAYMLCYCPAAVYRMDVATMAGVHNGGPGGSRVSVYVTKVQAALRRHGF